MDKKTLKPRIRFANFTDAWEQRKFQDIFDFERPDNYIVHSDKYSDDYSMPVLTANKAFVLGYTKENSPCTKTSLIFDDFTLECKYVDFPYMVKSSAIKILTIKNDRKDNLRFAFERLKSTKIEILGHARHYISVVQPTLTNTPNIAEQDKISTFFKHLDDLITLHQRKLEKLSNVKKSLLEKMFPQKNSTTPKVRFKGFTDAWEQRKLGDIMAVTSVKRIHQSDWQDQGIRFLRARDIVSFMNNEEPDDPLYISKEKYEEYSRISGKVEVDDLLVTGVGTIGVPYLIKSSTPIYFKDGNIIWFRNNKNIGGHFFYYSFASAQIQNFIKESAGIGTVGTYTIESGKKTPISLPQKQEQVRVGTFFNQLDNLITLHQRKLEKLKNVKKALLEKMFV